MIERVTVQQDAKGVWYAWAEPPIEDFWCRLCGPALDQRSSGPSPVRNADHATLRSFVERWVERMGTQCGARKGAADRWRLTARWRLSVSDRPLERFFLGPKGVSIAIGRQANGR